MSTPLKTGTLFGSLLYPIKWLNGNLENIRDLITARSQWVSALQWSATVLVWLQDKSSTSVQKWHYPPGTQLDAPLHGARGLVHTGGRWRFRPASGPGVLQSAIQELRAQTFHHPEAPEAIIGLCAEAQMDTGRRGGWSSVNKPDRPALRPACFSANPSPSLVCRAEN